MYKAELILFETVYSVYFFLSKPDVKHVSSVYVISVMIDCIYFMLIIYN